MAETATIQINVPKGAVPYLEANDPEGVFERDALIMYGLIQAGKISHGRATEILGIKKWDLIEYYNSIGFPYMNQSKEDLLAF